MRGKFFFERFQKAWNLNRKAYMVLILIMLLSVLMQAYFGTKKEGYHIDEMYNYGFSNSEYLPIIHFGTHDYMVKDWMKEYGAGDHLLDLIRNIGKDFGILKDNGFRIKDTPIYIDYLRAKKNSNDMTTTTWVSGQEYVDYLTATKDSRFNLASSYYNPRGDNHPPLYYMMSHIVCSFFPGVFSKWFGLGLNIFLMVITLGVLYQLVYRFTKDTVPSLLITAAYGWTSGAISTVLLIRMYVLLTLAFLLMAGVNLQIYEDDFVIKKKHGKQLIAVTVFGYLAQYAFIMYAIPLVIIMTVLMAARKKWKELLTYYIRLAWSALIGICLWPFGIKHIFGARGEGTMQKLTSAFDFERVKVMLWQLTSFLFNDVGIVWILVIAVTVLNILLIRRKKNLWQKECLLYIPVVFYFVVTAETVRLLADRYLMCIYPFMYIYLIVSVYFAIKELLRTGKKPAYIGAFMMFLILLFIGNGFVNEPGYLYSNGQETIQLPEDTDSVFVLIDGTYNESIEYASVLAQSKRVGVAYLSELGALRDGYEEGKGKYLCVFMQDYMNEDEVIQKVKEGLDTNNLTEVERTQTYFVKRVLLKTGD